MEKRTYIAIDLKSFYASVECVDKKLDPLKANLVVADPTRTDKTICLAVTPSLKAWGISGRARLFEVIQRVREINEMRLRKAGLHSFSGSSSDDDELKQHPEYKLDYNIAPPRMSHYMDISAKICGIYMRYVSPEDIHVYSIDEVFIDATPYLRTANTNGHSFARMLISDVLKETGITATAGIGTNLYLCKIAMDIVAKHMPPDKDGVRIAELDETSYREKLWSHTPITDFWRVGKGIARSLEKYGMMTMGDVARCSLGGKYDRLNEELLYKMFGVNAELLIDHAWGWEPCRISDIKAYRPETNSLSSGQVLQCPYESEAARLVIREMTDALSLDLVAKGLVTDQIVLTVGYDRTNTSSAERMRNYRGVIESDYYGRNVPKPAHGSIRLDRYTSSGKKMVSAVMKLFDRIVNKELLVRRMYVVAANIIPENQIPEDEPVQLDFFTDHDQEELRKEKENEALDKEKALQKAVVSLKQRFGKNAVLKGMDLEEDATARQRNAQVGGHKA